MLKITLMLGRSHDLPGRDQALVIDVARIADEVGLHAVALGEHVALTDRLEKYPYAGGLIHSEGAQARYFDPPVVLAAFAGVTSHVRLSTAIMLAPLRPAVLLAKQLTSLDVLSRGRCEPVFGTGWSEDEYKALGVDFGARRRILRDNIAACRALWGEQPASFKSETVSFEGLYQMPRPIQARIPILLGVKANENNAALIAELCDGWECGPDDSKSLETLRESVKTLHRAYAAIGRDPKDLIVRAHLAVVRGEDGSIDLDRTFAAAGPMVDVGVNQFGIALSPAYKKGEGSMAELGRYIGEIARIAGKY